MTKRIGTCLQMELLSLLRRKIVLILLLVIPAVFLTVVKLTSSERELPFRLSSVSKETLISISEQGVNFVFFSVASVGFLISFLALNLIQRNKDTSRRLIICGYTPQELLVSKLAALLLFIVAVSLYVGSLSHILHKTENFGSYVFSLTLIGLVYGCYGLLIGSLIKGELEGILMIVLLVNIDVGWLQNPFFYDAAQNQFLIRYLPAYYPSQTSIISAFTDHSLGTPLLYSILYGGVFLLLSLVTYFLTMKVTR